MYFSVAVVTNIISVLCFGGGGERGVGRKDNIQAGRESSFPLKNPTYYLCYCDVFCHVCCLKL